jgi:hypothetical protein
MWIAKYNCTFVYLDEDDEDEIGEEVMHIFKLKPEVKTCRTKQYK